jgi:SAM-dependent methyltransferase
VDAPGGYDEWSASYDAPGNPIVALEQPAMWAITDGFTPGRALDAGCGTGRHARHLLGQGHSVVGVDVSPGMLAVARESVPEATFVPGDLRDLPVADAQFEVIVSGLAVAHVRELDAVMSEFARALAPGGHAVVSALNPMQTFLGWHAPFTDADGGRRFVREHPHTHGDYIRSARAAGLSVQACVEPVLDEESVAAKRRLMRHIPGATQAAYLGLPGVVVWHFVKPEQ